MLSYSEDRPEAAAEIDLESRYREKTGRLAAEIQKLQQLLHASRERSESGW